MKVDAVLAADLERIASEAKRLEALGYDGLRLAELNHDPFMPLAIAAEHTERIELVTSVAVAFSQTHTTATRRAGAGSLPAYEKSSPRPETHPERSASNRGESHAAA